MMNNEFSWPTDHILPILGLDRALVGQLPPDLRDRLLDFMQTWGQPDEMLTLVEMLRESHGPLLFLLDYQAEAQLRAGQLQQALETNERRLRRSTTIASQALEARILLHMGRNEHAYAVATDLIHAYPKRLDALSAAAQVLNDCGHANEARRLLLQQLGHHPGNPSLILLLAQAAVASGQPMQADEYTQLLGQGTPAALRDDELRLLAALLHESGKQESAQAVKTELGRRFEMQKNALAAALAPYTAFSPAERMDASAIFRQLSGPESAPASDNEARVIRLAAARHFGFSALRPGQTETIACVLRGESVLAVMPTGAGKSLCYQIPALILPRASLVISPLIALMKDQVESLPPEARASVTFINSTLSDQEMAERMAGIAAGNYKLIYAAPERLRQQEFLRTLRRRGIDLFVIDEAHCVSLWGHDFRPDYLFLPEARRELGNPATLAMTATAPPRVRDEILDYMRSEARATEENSRIVAPRVITLDIFRHNLHLSAIRFNNEEEKLTAALAFVANTPGSGIIYVNTRHKAETLAFALRQAGVAAEAYHAGLPDRGLVQDRFMNDQTRVVVATVAFGMGIDKADIRFILHFHPSRSLAGYYQEVGRAGRDGKPSQGVLFYSNNDWANLRRWARAGEYSREFLETVYQAIAAQLSNDNERQHTIAGPVDPRRLQQVVDADETSVRVAASILERADLLARGFDVAQEVTITLPTTLPPAARSERDFRNLLAGLALRPGESATFRMADVARYMGWQLADCQSMLLDWQAIGWIQARWGRRVMFIEMPPTPPDRVERLERILAQSAGLAFRRIDDMVGYATTDGCRHGYISAHFGSPPRTHCTVCDNCTGVRPELPRPHESLHLTPDDADIEPMIIDCLMSLSRPVGRSGLARILAGHLRATVTPDKARHHGALRSLGEGGVLEYIDDLLESNRLRQYERQGLLVLAPTLSGRNEAEAWLAEHPEVTAAPLAAEPVETIQGEAAQPERYSALQKALWQWRRRTAESLGQPPYVVMSNELMLRIAESRPHTLDELALLPGMGVQRLQYYGPTILDIVRLHPAQEGDAELLAAQRAQSPVSTIARPKPPSARAEKRIFMRLQELRQRRAVTRRMKSFEAASTTLLKTIARRAPTTLVDLEAIPEFRESALLEDGPQIVAYIAEVLATEH